MRVAVPPALLLLAGCAVVIRPPAPVEDPVTVVLVDYGYHSSLILPGADGSTEYAYGEWDWFARNRDEWYRAVPTLCWPNAGTLGRRRPAGSPDRIVCEARHAFQVARNRAEALKARLDERFRKYEETAVYNEVNELTFVRDDNDYCFLFNCNDVVAQWVRELGCEVIGCTSFSSFRVER